MKIRTVEQLKKMEGKIMLVRVDFNVPLKDGKIAESYKIEKSLPTIKYLSGKKAKVILVSHLGRPKGPDEKLSLKPVADRLEDLLKQKIRFLDSDIIDRGFWTKTKGIIGEMENGEVALIENIRFFPGEEDNDKKLAKELAGLADIFVLDGFAVTHRDAASVSGVAKYLPAYAGLLLAEEIGGLSKALTKPKRPFVVVLGGIKMETKIPVLKKLLPLADHVLLCGGINNTYLWAKGFKVGLSLIDKDFRKEALLYGNKKKTVLPVDLVVGKENGSDAKVIDVDSQFAVHNTRFGIYDIGPKTIELYAKYIKKASTLVWNGSPGLFEVHPYEYGTRSIARLIAARAKGRAFGICGGGETVEVLKKLKLLDDVDLVSTGGGAMLEFLSGKKLPGVKAVTK